MENYSTILETAQPANTVFSAINEVAAWWTQNFEGESTHLNDTFKVTFGETFIVLKVTELVTNYKVVWHVTDCHKHFLQNQKEWVGTSIVFEISKNPDQTARLNFTHIGLTSPLECYAICVDAWGGYLHGSLKKLIETGKGTPDQKV